MIDLTFELKQPVVASQIDLLRSSSPEILSQIEQISKTPSWPQSHTELYTYTEESKMLVCKSGTHPCFQYKLQAYGAIKGRRNLPCGHRRSYGMRAILLSRLFALNSKRYSTEQGTGMIASADANTSAERNQARPLTRIHYHSNTGSSNHIRTDLQL